jgi:hypothetical protein
MLTYESRRTAGVLLVVFPSVLYGGFSLLTFLINPGSGYMQNPLRQNLFRAGHAHAGLLNWCNEAALVHWEQESQKMPEWDEAHRRLK